MQKKIKYVDLYRGEGKTLGMCKTALIRALKNDNVILLIPNRNHLVNINQIMSYIVSDDYFVYSETKREYDLKKGKIQIILQDEIEKLQGYTCNLFLVDEGQDIDNLDDIINSVVYPMTQDIIVYRSKGIK